MPTYEYACTSCGRHFDVVQSFSDDPLTTCEVCEGTLRRVFHPVGVLLKGSGFYSTDNRAGKKPAPTGKDAKETKDTKDTKDAPKDGAAKDPPKESASAEKAPAKKSPEAGASTGTGTGTGTKT